MRRRPRWYISSLASAEGVSVENLRFSAQAVRKFVQKYAENRKYAKMTHSRMVGLLAALPAKKALKVIASAAGASEKNTAFLLGNPLKNETSGNLSSRESS